jgi:hypothetical protein
MTSTNTFNKFSVLSFAAEPKVQKVSVPKSADKKVKASKEMVVPDLQLQYPYVMFLFSCITNNEFVIFKTNFSPLLKLKKDATALDLNKAISKMGLPFSCLVWGTTINVPELKKMLDNQYSLPIEYQHLHDLVCKGDILGIKQHQNVLILDFRRPYLKGKEYVYLPNHKQFFFGSVREAYVSRKSEVNRLKKYYDDACRSFNFYVLDKAILECHKCALNSADTEWIDFRENLIHHFRDAAEVFNMSDAKVFERFSTFEDLLKEIEMVKLYKQEIIEMLPKMQHMYERKMLAADIRLCKDEVFPSL